MQQLYRKGRKELMGAMRHAVLGAGRVGALVGGALAKAGHPVTLLVRPGRRNYYPERLIVESETLGTFEAPVRVADRFDRLFDVVWITVKATALKAALRTVSHRVTTSTLPCCGLARSKPPLKPGCILS